MHGTNLPVGSGWPLVSKTLDALVIGLFCLALNIKEIPQGVPIFCFVRGFVICCNCPSMWDSIAGGRPCEGWDSGICCVKTEEF